MNNLSAEASINLEEVVAKCDRLGRHLISKGYSEDEVDAIRADIYADEEEDEEIKDVVVGVELTDMRLRIKDLETELTKERDASASLLPSQAELQKYDKLNERVAQLKTELAHANSCNRNAMAGEHSRKNRSDAKVSLIQGDIVSLKIEALRAQVEDLKAINQAESAKADKKLEENIAYSTRVDSKMVWQKEWYSRLEDRLHQARANFSKAVIPHAVHSDLLREVITYFVDERPIFYARINCKVSKKESFIDAVARENTELKAVLKELEISRFKRVASKDDKVRRSQAKRRMAGKTSGSMEEKLSTPELSTPLKLARLNEMPDGPVDMATVSSTIVRILAKRKAVKRGAASCSVTSNSVNDSSKRRKVTSPINSQVVLEENNKIAEGADLRPHFEVEAGLMEEQCRAKARKKMVAIVDDEFKKEREAFQLEQEKEREAAALKLKEVRAESVAEAEQLVTTSATSRNNLAGKLYQLRYTKAEIMAFSRGNYEEKEIMDEEEIEEMEDGLNIAEKTAADNQETIDQEIKSSHLRVVDLEGLHEVEKKSSVELEKELDIAREREEQTLLYNAEYAKEYEALISQYEDRLDDNVKLSIKLEEAKRQVKDKTAIILSRNLALNQLTSELAELKEKAASGSRHEAELAKYRIRALNDEISDMKCKVHALNEHLLKKEIDLDTARTDLAVSEADFEKMNSSITGKDLELRNSAQIRDSLIARLDRLKANLCRLKGREAQSRANLVKIQAMNKGLVDDLAHARGNVRRAVQHDKEKNEIINQLCARISELERELRVREMKYKKDLKFKLDKRDGEIASGEGSREMKEFLRRKEELVENMRIDLTNSRQKLIDLTRQMSERIDQLTAELAKSKARRLKDSKRAAVTHQAFKELEVHKQEKCDGEALHQRKLSALVAFFVEEIKFLQVERDLM
ncbi:hypothetical protein GIB67_017242 [Kingdonia uniflora]|uniref:Uncharacterized protein n=1 Tax=Kingdonia uniflora TaxID=39325 RepID=A0A7J7NKN5_9MAGN|nr:hypothetical protein GIB67_017242 [Kingdonia uniflora]